MCVVSPRRIVRIGNMSKSNENGLKRRKEKAKQSKSSKKGKGPKVVVPRKREPKPTQSEKAWQDFKDQLVHQFRKDWVLSTFVLGVSMLLSALYLAVDVLDMPSIPPVTDVVRFEFSQGGTKLGIVEFGLFGATCPLTTKNFVMLTTHENGYGYKGSKIHMILPMHAIMGGDITNGDGTGGRSAIGKPFEKENFLVPHSGPGYLGMLSLENNRKSNKTSIFYVTTHEVHRYNGVNVAFGMVLGGMDVIKKIQSSQVDKNLVPLENITITDTFHTIV